MPCRPKPILAQLRVEENSRSAAFVSAGFESIQTEPRTENRWISVAELRLLGRVRLKREAGGKGGP